MPGPPGALAIGGRLETLQDDVLRWKGFLQPAAFETGVLAPSSKPVVLDTDWENRVRTVDVFDRPLITAGFTQDETRASRAFIFIFELP